MKLLALLIAFVVSTSADCASSLISIGALLNDPTDKKIKERCQGSVAFAKTIRDVMKECGADDPYLKIFLNIAGDTLCETKKFKTQTHYCLVPLLGLLNFTGVVTAITTDPSGAAVKNYFETYDWSSYPDNQEAKVCSVPKCTSFLETTVVKAVKKLIRKDIIDQKALEILDDVLLGLRNCGPRKCRKKWPSYWKNGALNKNTACKADGTLRWCATRKLLFDDKLKQGDHVQASKFCCDGVDDDCDAVVSTMIDDVAIVVVKVPNLLWSYYKDNTAAIEAYIVVDVPAAAVRAASEYAKESDPPAVLLSGQISLKVEKDTQSSGVLITINVTTTNSDVQLGGLTYFDRWLKDNQDEIICLVNMDKKTLDVAFANQEMPFTLHNAEVVSVETHFAADGPPASNSPASKSGAETGYACSSALVAFLGSLALY